MIDRAVSEEMMPALNLLVLKNGAEVLYHEAGDIHRDNVLRMFSMTKPLTGFAAMLLLERGEITLGDPLERYIPEFAGVRVVDPATKEIRVRRRPIYIKDLLCMTSGLSYPGDKNDPSAAASGVIFDEMDRRLYTDDPVTTNEFAVMMAERGLLAFEPGESWLYGTSADIMGAVIEIISGVSFNEFMRREIFEPLGMEDTAFYCPTEKSDRLAKAYEYPRWIVNPFDPASFCPEEKGTWKPYDRDHLAIKRKGDAEPAFASGGAGIFSTLDDYAKFATMLLGGGEYRGRRLMSSEMVKYFTSGGLTPWQRERFWKTWDSLAGYDYGNYMRLALGSSAGQTPQWKGGYGWDGWLGTYFMNVPDSGLTVLVGTQVTDAGALPYIQQIRNLLYTDKRLR